MKKARWIPWDFATEEGFQNFEKHGSAALGWTEACYK